LIGNYMHSCNAVRDVYVPSRYELDEYCQSSRCTICPCYAKAERGGRSNAQGLTAVPGGLAAQFSASRSGGGRFSS